MAVDSARSRSRVVCGTFFFALLEASLCSNVVRLCPAFLSCVFATLPVPASLALPACLRAFAAAFRMPVLKRPRSLAPSTSAMSASRRQRIDSNVGVSAHSPPSVVVVVVGPCVELVVAVVVGVLLLDVLVLVDVLVLLVDVVGTTVLVDDVVDDVVDVVVVVARPTSPNWM